MSDASKTPEVVRLQVQPRRVPIPARGDIAAVRPEEPMQARAEATGDPPRSPRLLDRVRQEIRTRHYSPRTEKAYVAWTKRFIFFNDKRHPKDMGEREISAFISHLATRRNVSASTRAKPSPHCYSSTRTSSTVS